VKCKPDPTVILGNLVSPERYVPSMDDVAAYLLSYLSRSFDAFKERAGPPAMFEAALFGACARTGSLYVFHFRPELVGGVYVLSVMRHTALQDGDFVYLGDERIKLSEAIAAAHAEPEMPGRPKSRLPRYVIQDHISDPAYESIGGDIQLAIADRAGFRPFMICKPRVHGQPQAYFSYLGRELTDDLKTVGQTIVGGQAMV